MKAFVFKTNFTDGRNNFHDVVAADDEDGAYQAANIAVRSIDEIGFGADEFATAEIICALAVDPRSLGECSGGETMSSVKSAAKMLAKALIQIESALPPGYEMRAGVHRIDAESGINFQAVAIGDTIRRIIREARG